MTQGVSPGAGDGLDEVACAVRLSRASGTEERAGGALPGSFVAAGGIDLWFVPLSRDLPVAECVRLLSPAEITRAHSFVNEGLHRSYCVSHACLRLILARYTTIAPGSHLFSQGLFGKPGLVFAGLEFNMSHSGDAILVGVAQRPVGVDVEHLDRARDLDDAAAVYLDPGEYAAVSRLPVEQRRCELLRQWTCREACAKALGLGLHLDLRTLHSRPGGYRSEEYGGFAVLPLQPARGFVAALAVQGIEPSPATFRFARVRYDEVLSLIADLPIPLGWSARVTKDRESIDEVGAGRV